MDVHDKKQEAIICPVLGEEIPNRRKWCANRYLRKVLDIAKMTKDYQVLQTLYCSSIRQLYLLMVVFGMDI